MSKKADEITTEIVRDIANEFREMIPTRNHLVHGRWQIGLPFPENLPKELVEKYKVTRTGLEKRDDLPKSFDEIVDLAKQNRRLLGVLGRFLQFFIYTPEKIEEVFAKVEGSWVFTFGDRTEQWKPRAWR